MNILGICVVAHVFRRFGERGGCVKCAVAGLLAPVIVQRVMRLVTEALRPECKISVFSWNSKYLIKFEQGLLEQTYKISELDVSGDGAVKKLLTDEVFIGQLLKRFEDMRLSLGEACAKL